MCGRDLVQIDPTTARFSHAAGLDDLYAGLTTSGDLVGLPDGDLYGSVAGGDDLVRLNPRTGNARRVGSIGDEPVLQIDPDNAEAAVVGSELDAWFGATTNPVRW